MSTEALRAFVEHFGGTAEVVVRAPGRVNIIGEHTDYNGGWVLPAAIDRGTDVIARSRADRRLHIWSTTFGDAGPTHLDDLDPSSGPAWATYISGAALVLAEAGVALTGADIVVGGDLPIGAGLSSSASVTLGVLGALLATSGSSLDPVDLARLGQRVENEVVGVATGIMDQLAVACGTAGHALLIDCRSLEFEPVPVPSDLRLLVLDSAVPRRLAESGYNQRQAECERAVRVLRQLDPSLRSLRDATPDLLDAAASDLDPVSARRARHVVTEDQRVLDAAAALRGGDGQLLGRLLTESHASLRDDYEVSVSELDQLVDIAEAEPGVVGARLTGAGFGGSAVALVDDSFSDEAADRLIDRYRATTGRDGSAFVCDIGDGMRKVQP